MFYFAYGSNLDADDFARWCEENGCVATLRAVKAAWLPDAEAVFDYRSKTRDGGTLDVRSRIGGAVAGMLFDVDDTGWRALDRKEGAPDRYVRVERTVLTESGDEERAWTYVVTPQHRQAEHVPPTRKYLLRVCDALERFGLSSEHVRRAAEGRGGSTLPLFVYGTLMRGQAQHALLGRAKVSEARARGTLVSLGDYPGLLPGRDHTVHGELAELEHHDAIAELDAYEGFAGYGRESLFRRIVVRAETRDRTAHAWAYVYAGALEGALPIASGDWRRR